MPDLNDVFRDDRMGELGFEAAQDLDAKGIVTHRCGFCHDGRFPGQTRDRFNVADFPGGLNTEMKDKVVDRLRRGKSSPLRMPPTLFADLAPEQIDAVEAALGR